MVKVIISTGGGYTQAYQDCTDVHISPYSASIVRANFTSNGKRYVFRVVGGFIGQEETGTTTSGK